MSVDRPREVMMDVALVRRALLWCTVVNYGVLLAWFLLFAFAHDWMWHIHGRWFHLSAELFDALHYGAMAIYKIGILLFNLVPLIALCLVDRSR
jgi:hypothetical protein